MDRVAHCHDYNVWIWLSAAIVLGVDWIVCHNGKMLGIVPYTCFVCFSYPLQDMFIAFCLVVISVTHVG